MRMGGRIIRRSARAGVAGTKWRSRRAKAMSFSTAKLAGANLKSPHHEQASVQQFDAPSSSHRGADPHRPGRRLSMDRAPELARIDRQPFQRGGLPRRLEVFAQPQRKAFLARARQRTSAARRQRPGLGRGAERARRHGLASARATASPGAARALHPAHAHAACPGPVLHQGLRISDARPKRLPLLPAHRLRPRLQRHGAGRIRGRARGAPAWGRQERAVHGQPRRDGDWRHRGRGVR